MLPNIPQIQNKTNYEQFRSDLVYPHSFKNASWPTQADANTTKCSAAIEDFVHHVETNHMYMERTQKPSIAARLFFLFQDAVVQCYLQHRHYKSRREQQFNCGHARVLRHIQWINMNLSSLMPNIVMTLVIMTLLLGTSITIGVYGGRAKEAELQSLMTAHNVAELLIHEKKYPALLIRKSLSVSAPSSTYSSVEPELEPVDLEATPSATPRASIGDDLE